MKINGKNKQKILIGVIKKNLLFQIEHDGGEIKIETDCGRARVRRANPLETLFKSRKITRQEYAAGTRYQRLYELANLSHHSRPSYDGTPISAVTAKIAEKTPSAAELEANKFIAVVRTALINSRESNLIEILEKTFEKQLASLHVEKSLKLSYRALSERISKICKILLDI